jgi:hypothetical protein
MAISCDRHVRPSDHFEALKSEEQGEPDDVATALATTDGAQVLECHQRGAA